MNKILVISSAVRVLLQKPWYISLAGVLSVFLFIMYFIVNNFAIFSSIFAVSRDPILLWKVFANQVETVWDVAGPLNVLAVALVSFLAGINIALVALKTAKTKVFIGRANIFGIFGMFGGAFGAACSACNTALIGILGISGGLAVFPLQGLEFSLLAIALLTFSIYYVSKSMYEMGIFKIR